MARERLMMGVALAALTATVALMGQRLPFRSPNIAMIAARTAHAAAYGPDPIDVVVSEVRDLRKDQAPGQACWRHRSSHVSVHSTIGSLRLGSPRN